MCELVPYHGTKSMISFFTILTNCFMQSPHNFKAVFLIDRTIMWEGFMMQNRDTQSNKTVTKSFTFDRTYRAIFGLGPSGVFHWDDWALVSMS